MDPLLTSCRVVRGSRKVRDSPSLLCLINPADLCWCLASRTRMVVGRPYLKLQVRVLYPSSYLPVNAATA